MGLKEAEGGAERMWPGGLGEGASGGGREAGRGTDGAGAGQARRGRGLESGQKAEAG